MSVNRDLHKAKLAKKDEFYTQITDIEKELKHYKEHFRGKVVYCNCDDPRVSNFFRYFSYNFKVLGLKKLITTCYKSQEIDLFSQNKSERAIWLEYEGTENENGIPTIDRISAHPLEGDGDFRSEECIQLLKQSDIVVTNPPFSLFREYVAQLVKYNKAFLILGNQNAISYQEVFKQIKQNKIWLGVDNGGEKWFEVNSDYTIRTKSRQKVKNGKKYFSMGNVNWFTNLDHSKRHDDLILYKKYTPDEYPKYDNYNAIEVSTYLNIPTDYDGIMGVPISFLDKFNLDQFEILGITDRANSSGLRTKKYTPIDTPKYSDLNARGVIRIGNTYKLKYVRLLIRKRA